jgi:hypothetical protein
MAPNIRIQ